MVVEEIVSKVSFDEFVVLNVFDACDGIFDGIYDGVDDGINDGVREGLVLGLTVGLGVGLRDGVSVGDRDKLILVGSAVVWWSMYYLYIVSCLLLQILVTKQNKTKEKKQGIKKQNDAYLYIVLIENILHC